MSTIEELLERNSSHSGKGILLFSKVGTNIADKLHRSVGIVRLLTQVTK
jgi:hypothetical protein